jgi:hypothetical protein
MNAVRYGIGQSNLIGLVDLDWNPKHIPRSGSG